MHAALISLLRRWSLVLLAGALAAPAQAGLVRTLLAAGAGAAAMHFGAAAAHAGRGAGTLEGRIVHIEDGDTVTLLTADHVQHKIRLASIDAPEMQHGKNRPAQPFSRAAKNKLGELLGTGLDVRAQCPDTDKYGRAICTLYVGSVNVNLELVKAGAVWANTARPEYLRDPAVLTAQQSAQAAKRGLWSQPGAVPPWNWRQVCWEQHQCAGAGD